MSSGSSSAGERAGSMGMTSSSHAFACAIMLRAEEEMRGVCGSCSCRALACARISAARARIESVEERAVEFICLMNQGLIF